MNLVERPYPELAMQKLTKAVFGEGDDPKYLLIGTASWGRSLEELHGLISNQYLAEYEWKEELKNILNEKQISNSFKNFCYVKKCFIFIIIINWSFFIFAPLEIFQSYNNFLSVIFNGQNISDYNAELSMNCSNYAY